MATTGRACVAATRATQSRVDSASTGEASSGSATITRSTPSMIASKPSSDDKRSPVDAMRPPMAAMTAPTPPPAPEPRWRAGCTSAPSSSWWRPSGRWANACVRAAVRAVSCASIGSRSGATASTESRPSSGRAVDAAHTRSTPASVTRFCPRVRASASASGRLGSMPGTPRRPSRKPTPQSGERLCPPSTITAAPLRSESATRSPASRDDEASVGTRTNEAWERKVATASSKVGPVPNGTVTTSGSAAPAYTPRQMASSASPVGRAGTPPSHRPAMTTRFTGTPRASAAEPQRGSRPSGRR